MDGINRLADRVQSGHLRSPVSHWTDAVVLVPLVGGTTLSLFTSPFRAFTIRDQVNPKPQACPWTAYRKVVDAYNTKNLKSGYEPTIGILAQIGGIVLPGVFASTLDEMVLSKIVPANLAKYRRKFVSVLTELLFHPVRVIDTRILAQPYVEFTASPVYTGFIDGARKIKDKEGIAGLFKGAEVTIVRIELARRLERLLQSQVTIPQFPDANDLFSADLVVAQGALNKLAPYNVALNMTISSALTLIPAVVLYPIDTIAVRLMVQRDNRYLVVGLKDVVTDMYKEGGHLAFYSGVWMRIYSILTDVAIGGSAVVTSLIVSKLV